VRKLSPGVPFTVTPELATNDTEPVLTVTTSTLSPILKLTVLSAGTVILAVEELFTTISLARSESTSVLLEVIVLNVELNPALAGPETKSVVVIELLNDNLLYAIAAEELISISTIVPSKIIEDVTVFVGRVTVPVNVGDASGALRAILFVSVVDRAASFPSAVAISPRVSSVAPALLTRFATSARTNAVVASCVVFVDSVAVGAVGTPAKAGEASVAKPDIEAPAGIVTVPVKVGEAIVALRSRAVC